MIPAWLTSFCKWIAGLFVHEAVEQVKEEIKKPDTLEDAKTPKDVRDGFNAYLDDKLRDKNTDIKQ